MEKISRAVQAGMADTDIASAMGCSETTVASVRALQKDPPKTASDVDAAVDKFLARSGRAHLHGDGTRTVHFRPTRTTERLLQDKDLFIAWFDGDAAGTMAQTPAAALEKLLRLTGNGTR